MAGSYMGQCSLPSCAPGPQVVIGERLRANAKGEPNVVRCAVRYQGTQHWIKRPLLHLCGGAETEAAAVRRNGICGVV